MTKILPVLEETEVTYTFSVPLQIQIALIDTKVTRFEVRCYVVTDEGDPYLYVDPTFYGYRLTKAGKHDERRGYGLVSVPLYEHHLPGTVPSPIITEWVAPVVRDVILPRHPEFAGLPIEGPGSIAKVMNR